MSRIFGQRRSRPKPDSATIVAVSGAGWPGPELCNFLTTLSQDVFVRRLSRVNPHEYLVARFGHRPFRVSDLTDDARDELAEMLDIRAPTNVGARTMIGKWLSAHPELVTVVQDDDADGTPSVYQMR